MDAFIPPSCQTARGTEGWLLLDDVDLHVLDGLVADSVALVGDKSVLRQIRQCLVDAGSGADVATPLEFLPDGVAGGRLVDEPGVDQLDDPALDQQLT